MKRDRLNLHDARDYAEHVARTLADTYQQRYLVHYCGTDDFGPVWRTVAAPDVAPERKTAGCARFTVDPMHDTYPTWEAV